jgi:pimeloyl-ACP methyl ester carboxylesterase
MFVESDDMFLSALGLAEPAKSLFFVSALVWNLIAGMPPEQNFQTTQPYRLQTEGLVENLPYERNSTTDRFGRKINFYLRFPRLKPSEPLPLVVYIQGSACQSIFEKQPDGSILPAGGHEVIPQVSLGRVLLLVVEKPGIEFLHTTTPGESYPKTFREEHTLERWAEAVEAAVRAAQESPRVLPGKLLVIGHSEGGQVACKVAQDLPGLVTHVACAAGGGPSFLADILVLAREGTYFGEVSDKPQERVKYVLDEWKKIQQDPMSTEKHFFGFPYRYWSTFLASSPIEILPKVDAEIYIAQGTQDNAVDPASADLLYGHLLARGKRPTYDRIEGAGHSFDFSGEPTRDGWGDAHQRIVKWFLPEP